MKFFTRAWATGELPDEESDAAFSKYEEHLAALALPPDARALADTYLHDGILETLDFTGEMLILVFVTGNLQNGYFTTTLTYYAPEISQADLTKLRSFAGNDRRELLYQEVDRSAGRIVHGMLFSTYEDLEIAFRTVTIRQTPRCSRDLTT